MENGQNCLYFESKNQTWVSAWIDHIYQTFYTVCWSETKEEDADGCNYISYTSPRIHRKFFYIKGDRAKKIVIKAISKKKYI